MAESIKESCKLGVAAYAAQAREQWVLEWPGQVVLAVSAIFWTSAVTNALTNGIPGLLLSASLTNVQRQPFHSSNTQNRPALVRCTPAQTHTCITQGCAELHCHAKEREPRDSNGCITALVLEGLLLATSCNGAIFNWRS